LSAAFDFAFKSLRQNELVGAGIETKVRRHSTSKETHRSVCPSAKNSIAPPLTLLGERGYP
jgi:hypothetical protein